MANGISRLRKQAWLQKRIATLPQAPGIYCFQNRSGGNLYIGKAANLRARVRSYLKPTDARIRAMIEKSADLKYFRTASDIEALIAESQMIKKHKPSFNVMMRDDKQYFYVGFTGEDFPKIFLTHQPTSWNKELRIRNNRAKIRNSKFVIPNSELIGPFTDGTALKTTLRMLRRIFPYCTCTQEHNVFCLNYHIGRCIGWCCIKEQKTEVAPTLEGRSPDRIVGRVKNKELESYRRNIRAIKDLLTGKRETLIRALEKEMKTLGSAQKLEDALALQRKIEKVKRVFENARIIAGRESQTILDGLTELGAMLNITPPRRIEGYDISHIRESHAAGAMVVFENGMPQKYAYRKFKIRRTSGGDTAMIREILRRRFQHPEWPHPDVIVVDGGKAQLNAARETTPKHIPIVALKKDERHRGKSIVYKTDGAYKAANLSRMPKQTRNLILSIDGEAHRFAVAYHKRLRRGAMHR